MNHEPILTQSEVVIDLSVPALKAIVYELRRGTAFANVLGQTEVEVNNFVNLLTNLIERRDPAQDPVVTSVLGNNLDLI